MQTAAIKAADAINSSPSSLVGAAVGSAAIIHTASRGQAAYKKIKGSYNAMRAMASSTLGRGNGFWFEDDEDLLNQLAGH